MKKSIAILTLLLSSSAFAGEGWYVGATAGVSNTDNANNISAWNNSSNNGVVGVLAGYQFNRNFALEGAYTGAGKFSNAAVSGKSDILTLDAVGMIEVMPAFNLYGKVGMGSATSKSVSGAGYSGTTHSAVTAGLGVQYDVTRHVAARLGYDYYQTAINTPNNGTPNFASNVVSAGVLYHF